MRNDGREPRRRTATPRRKRDELRNIDGAGRVGRMPLHDVMHGTRRWKVANNPNQQNEKEPQADRDEEQRRQQQQQGGQNRQPGGEAGREPDRDRTRPQQG